MTKRYINKGFIFLTFIILSTFIFPSAKLYAVAGAEMNIYAMYLDTDVKGDSVLLESDGEYLLMDMGTVESVPAIIRQLKSLNAKKIKVYISHMHADHYGGYSDNSRDNGSELSGLNMLVDEGFEITSLYIADSSIAPDSERFQYREAKFEKYVSETLHGEVVRLKMGSSFTFGSAKVDILGPIDGVNTTLSDYAGTGDKLNFYENDHSLAAMVTCGSTKFFTAGDCWEREASSLVEKYGENLRADIMKLNHHGTTTGNSDELFAAIKPRFSFASNCGLTGINESTGKWETAPSVKKANQYGITFLPGSEKKTLVYHIENDSIKMYYESVSDENLMRGETWLYGGDGQYREKDLFLLDDDGKVLTGVQKFNGRYLYLGESGCMQYGVYDAKGKCGHWRRYGNDLRYFRFDKSEKYAECMVGIRKLTDYDNSIRYFYKNGILKRAKKDREIFKVGKKWYCCRDSGTLVCGLRVSYKNAVYYFDKKGVMARNKTVKIKGKKYYFGKDGKQKSL